jgi:hypothetical protein
VTRVVVIVEGYTEESFVQQILAPFLWPSGVYVFAIILGVPGHKGGRTNYARVKKDVLRQLSEDRAAYCSTMFDFSGLGKGFPGTPLPLNLAGVDKVIHLERAMRDDIIAHAPDLRPDVRFIPYLQLHEYEALLFSGPEAFATGIFQPGLAGPLREIREKFPTPEDIDDTPTGAPSKRILRLCRSYNKVLDGTRAAVAVGVPAMQDECLHFRDWLDRLRRTGTPTGNATH